MRQHMPANARQAEVWPVPLENYAACRSVSDDDLSPDVHISVTAQANSVCAGSMWLTASGPHDATLTVMRNLPATAPDRTTCRCYLPVMPITLNAPNLISRQSGPRSTEPCLLPFKRNNR